MSETIYPPQVGQRVITFGRAVQAFAGELRIVAGEGCRVDRNGSVWTVHCQPSTSLRVTSFSFKKVVDDKIHVTAGTIRWSGRGKYKLLENDVANVVVVGGGTKEVPGFISIRVTSRGAPSDAVLAYTTVEPEDDGTYYYKPLYEVWLDTAGKAVCGNDLRLDWRLGSPIG